MEWIDQIIEVRKFLLKKPIDANRNFQIGFIGPVAPIIWIVTLTLHLCVYALMLMLITDINLPDEDGHTSLIWSCYYGHIDIASLLLDYGADINKETDLGDTALICACDKGHVEMAALLIKRGANINATNKKGQTALISSCDKGFIDLITLLLESGADINARDKNGFTAFILLCRIGHLDLLSLLVGMGADINIKSYSAISGFDYLRDNVTKDELRERARKLANWTRKRDMVAMLYGSGLQLLPPTTEETQKSNSLHGEDKRHYQGAMTNVLENSDLIRELAEYF
jgi:hypothetical protein